MFGIEDPWILTAYLLCFLSAFACIIYGIMNWNKGADKEPDELKEGANWEIKESEIEETL
jgi:hypothetical protein